MIRFAFQVPTPESFSRRPPTPQEVFRKERADETVRCTRSSPKCLPYTPRDGRSITTVRLLAFSCGAQIDQFSFAVILWELMARTTLLSARTKADGVREAAPAAPQRRQLTHIPSLSTLSQDHRLLSAPAERI